MNNNNVLSATVKKDGRKINVYKLTNGKYNIFLGEKLNMAKVEQKEHMETFEADELNFTGS